MNGIPGKFSFFTNTRHDLRTALNAIIGYSEMLVDDSADMGWEDISPDLQKINHAGRDLLEVINEAFAPARIQALTTGNVEEIIDSKLDFQIRTSTNAILGYTEMALEEADDHGLDQIVSELQKIRSSTNLFLSLIRDLSGIQLKNIESSPDLMADRVPSTDKETVPQRFQSRGDCELVRRASRGDVLVVEDNPMNREMLASYLSRLGHTVEIAENGEQALEMLGRRCFDLVLLDIIMPVMDGFQVLMQLKTE